MHARYVPQIDSSRSSRRGPAAAAPRTRREADALLVRRAQRGDAAAFDALTRTYYSRVVRLVNRFARDPDESLDLAQEVFVKAYLALPRFRGDCSFFTWLFEIALNASRNYAKSRSRRSWATPVDIDEAESTERPELCDQDSPEQLLLRDELREGLIGALDRLPWQLRSAFVLREFELQSYEEIAEEIRCPLGTVRSRIFRARAAIAEELRVRLD